MSDRIWRLRIWEWPLSVAPSTSSLDGRWREIYIPRWQIRRAFWRSCNDGFSRCGWFRDELGTWGLFWCICWRCCQRCVCDWHELVSESMTELSKGAFMWKSNQIIVKTSALAWSMCEKVRRQRASFLAGCSWSIRVWSLVPWHQVVGHSWPTNTHLSIFIVYLSGTEIDKTCYHLLTKTIRIDPGSLMVFTCWILLYQTHWQEPILRPAGQEPVNWLHYKPGYDTCFKEDIYLGKVRNLFLYSVLLFFVWDQILAETITSTSSSNTKTRNIHNLSFGGLILKRSCLMWFYLQPWPWFRLMNYITWFTYNYFAIL